jgi:hypothetical protein
MVCSGQSRTHLEETAKAVGEVCIIDVFAGQATEKGLQRVACLMPAPPSLLRPLQLLSIDLSTCRDKVIQ